MKPRIQNLYTLYGNTFPSSIEFKNYSTYKGCYERYKKYSEKILKLNSLFVTFNIEIKELQNIILDIITNKNIKSKNDIVDLNIDILIQKSTNKENYEIPKCLSSAIDNIDIYNINNKDIFNPNIIPEYNNSKPTVKQDVQNTELINNLDLYIDNLLTSVFEDYSIYELILRIFRLQEFILKSKFIIIYRDFKDYYKCLEENCKALNKGLVDDYFLYNNNFIIPIDIPTAKIKVNKFMTDFTLNEKQKNNLIELDKYYNIFVKNKKYIIEKAYNRIKDLGVKDEENPFKELLQEFIYNKINTIF